MKKWELTNGDVAVGALEHFVHAFGAERGAEDASDVLGGGDVGFLSIQPSQPRLLLLLLQDYERPSVFIESQRHYDLTFQTLSLSLWECVLLQKEGTRRKKKP